MRAHLHPDAASFLERTMTLRTREPYLTNVMGSVASSLAQGIRAYERASFWTIEDDDAIIQGMMMRTAPHNLTLSPMPRDAIATAVSAVMADDPDVPGVTGPREVTGAFVHDFVAASGLTRSDELERVMYLYVLNTLRAPEPGAGGPRPGTADDFSLLLAWWSGFARDTAVSTHGLDASVRELLSEGRVFVWIHNEQPVCAVAHSATVATPAGSVVRVGPVYTPDAERRRGYASQLTAAVSKRLVNQGHTPMLFTDAANPTSNGVYARLGYEKIDQVVEYTLARTDPT